MISILDVLIIAIALIALQAAVLLLRPQAGQRERYLLSKYRAEAEQERKQLAQIIETIQHGAQDANYLGEQLKTRFEQINKDCETSKNRADDAGQVIQHAREAERELRDISSQLADRIQHVQNYWDQQLQDTVDTVRTVKQKLQTGLSQVDDGILRLREQERLAQGLTRKLLEHQKSQLSAQEEHARLSAEVQTQLETMLQESTLAMSRLREQQETSEQRFSRHSEEMETLEQQAQEQFTSLFQTTDMARQELEANLEESRRIVGNLRENSEQGQDMTSKVREQFAQVENLKVDRLTQTVSLTDEMCADLQEGLENARTLLKTLENKTAQVISESESTHAEAEAASEPPRHLFSLKSSSHR
ncbi:MAG: hypothetical protein KDI44_09795 [Thiothrix sp.]|nr:hypothetical protein [Thiothrix sp.]HPQ94351.1 hypothetical protein [Thiolinea sp.]